MAEAAAIIEPTPAPAPQPTPASAPVAAPAAVPDPKPAATVLEGDPAAAPVAAPADWPDDWRTKIAATDEKLLKRLERFASPKALTDSYLALEQRIKTGELKLAKLPDDATDEQKAEWRKAQGVPEKVDDYLAELPEGLVIGEEEKGLVEDFLKDMHGKDIPKKFVQEALAWNQKQKELQQDALFEANTQAKQLTEDTLRTEFGNEYRANLNQVKALLSSAPDGAGDLLMSAQTPEGVALFNNPGVIRWLVNLAKEINPVATLTGGSNTPSAIEDRMTTIQKMMGDHSSEYWKGPNAEKLQAEYRTLIEAKQRHK